MIKKFTPFCDIEIEDILKKFIGDNWIYAPSGRACFYHILKAYNVKNVAIPNYICSSVLEPIKKLKINFYVYDIDKEDLNPSFNSFKEIYIKNNKIDCVLVPSLYGNPADLINFEKFCKANNIVMIDDAAQAFGAKLENKFVGTFGETGFFSISPAKPLYGHLGGFLRIKKNLKINYKNEFFYHCLKKIYFLYRKNIYKFDNKFFEIFILLLIKIYEKIFDTYYGKMNNFEKDSIINSILYQILLNNEIINTKNNILKSFLQLEKEFSFVRIISNKRGISNPIKLVLIIEKDTETINLLKRKLKEKKIYFLNGYKLIENNSNFKNSFYLNGKIFEFPLEKNKKNMNYLLNSLNEIFKTMNK